MPTLIISFIVETGKKLSETLDSIAEVKGEAGKELKKIAEDLRKDAEQLERIFKETVVELSLEPIEGFDVDSLREEISNLLGSEEKVSGLIKAISRLETIYTSFARSIASISPETSMQLKKMARKKEKYRKFLEALK
ncbi:MAG: hypothetical protein PWQ22_714 [Archaeoglobaceae archaeon]|nr:hypothetical protein [Archaeoglobaceae archaeon]MDK2876304.1 hypothetical protein [Archaeoglobaceae archaeon]